MPRPVNGTTVLPMHYENQNNDGKVFGEKLKTFAYNSTKFTANTVIKASGPLSGMGFGSLITAGATKHPLSNNALMGIGIPTTCLGMTFIADKAGLFDRRDRP